MKFARLLTAAAVSLFATVPAAFAAHTHVPTPSVWKLDVAASDFGGAPAPKSEILTQYIDTEQRSKYSDVLVDADGKTTRSSWDGPYDGTFKPIKGMPGVTQAMNTADDSIHTRMPDGSTQDGIFFLSDDKKTVTLKGTIKDKTGKVINQTILYRRIK